MGPESYTAATVAHSVPLHHVCILGKRKEALLVCPSAMYLSDTSDQITVLLYADDLLIIIHASPDQAGLSIIETVGGFLDILWAED